MDPGTPTVPRQIAMGVLFLAVVTVVAVIGSLATIPNTNGWYLEVEKVPWNPPNWLFGPTWSVLYFLVAVAGFLTWRSGYNGTRNRARPALALWAVQMVMNSVWTPVFFAGYPLVGRSAWWAGLIVILLLVATVTALIPATVKWSKTAAWLLVPYLVWLIFATTLNAGIIFLN